MGTLADFELVDQRITNSVLAEVLDGHVIGEPDAVRADQELVTVGCHSRGVHAEQLRRRADDRVPGLGPDPRDRPARLGHPHPQGPRRALGVPSQTVTQGPPVDFLTVRRNLGHCGRSADRSMCGARREP